MSENDIPTAKRTLVVNFYGGPGLGKSTAAAGLFARLKCLGVNCELVREYAKELVWERSFERLTNQVLVTAQQYHRQVMVDGKVDVMITDSPLLLGQIYRGRGCNAEWDAWLNSAFSEFANLNVVLKRNSELRAYDPEGRMHSEAEAIAKDDEIVALLNRNGFPWVTIPVQTNMTETQDKLVLAVVRSYAEHTGYALPMTRVPEEIF